MPLSAPQITRRGLLAAGAALSAMPIAGVHFASAAAGVPLLGPLRPSVYRVRLGDFEVTSILDGSVQADGPFPTFGMNQPEAEVKKFAADNLLPENKVESSFTPVIVNTGREVILFDTGNGAARRPNAGRLAATLDLAGLSSDQIDAVVITHFHADHIGGLMEGGSPAFSKARYFVGQAEYDFWSNKDLLTGPLEANAKVVQTNVVPLIEKITFLKPEQEVVPGIRAIDASGHTPGMLGFNIESQGKRLVLIGDTVNHYVMSLGRPEWHVRSDMDKEKAVATRKAMLDMLATDKVPFAGFHMPFPAFGFVEKTADGFRWVPHTYQLHV